MCPLIPVVRDSPTLPARPVRGRSSARRQHLAMAPYINSYLMVPHAVAYVSLGTFRDSKRLDLVDLWVRMALKEPGAREGPVSPAGKAVVASASAPVRASAPPGGAA